MNELNLFFETFKITICFLPFFAGKIAHQTMPVGMMVVVTFTMSNTMIFEDYAIERIENGNEVNYLITKKGCRVCRLVPWEDGFDLAPEDKSCGLPADELSRINDFILSYKS